MQEFRCPHCELNNKVDVTSNENGIEIYPLED